MHLKRLILLAILLLLVPQSGLAEMVRQQGVGQITYSGWGGPSAEIKRQAIEKAKLSAVEKYTAGFSTAKMIHYNKIRTTVEGNLDRYIPEYKFIDDELDKDSKRYSVVIDAAINVSLIEVELQKVSAVQQTKQDERSFLSFVFVARKVKSRKSFDARQTSRTVVEKSAEENEESNADGGKLSYASESVNDTTKTTGGSIVQKSDEVEYDVSSADGINSTMTRIFSLAGYEVVEAEYLQDETGGLVNVENFLQDFRFGDDISGNTRRDAAKGCRAVGVQYFAIGTLDVGAKNIDPASGLTRVYVSVNGKIMDLQGRFPKTVASVGPVQYAGVGPDQAVAKQNALQQAGESAAKDLTSQLRAKDIR